MNHTEHKSGPPAAAAVRRELMRAIGGALIAPIRMAFYVLRGRSVRRGVRADLEHCAAVEEARETPLPDRPLEIFISCAEASGEAHAVELVEEIRRVAIRRGAPEPVFMGLGGKRLAAAGVRIVGDPVERAAMGADVVRSLSFFFALLKTAAQELRDRRPDCVVVVDSPALHVPLGHIAKRYDLPVVHYVTPQYWAWAPWRVRGYRSAVDLALTILPFEPSWFARHGVRTAHVGHPQLDLLADVTPGGEEERTQLVLLPGSRGSVIQRNLPWMLDVARAVRAEVPGLDVVLPHSRPELADKLHAIVAEHGKEAGDIRIVTGDLHAELDHASIALSVSGTVLLDLLHHRIPTACVYRLRSPLLEWLQGSILSVPWFASVNLLAGREVLPEFAFSNVEPTAEVADLLVQWHTSPDKRRQMRAELERTAERLGTPGAARRAAGHILAMSAPAPGGAGA